MSNIERGCKKQFKLQELSDTLNNIDLLILYILSLSLHHSFFDNNYLPNENKDCNPYHLLLLHNQHYHHTML